MASLMKRGNAYTIQFTDRTGKRKTIGLGTIKAHAAKQLKTRIEGLVSAHVTATPVDPQTAKWLREVSDKLRSRMAMAGLTEAATAWTVESLAEEYIGGKAGSVKPGTLARLRRSKASLLDHIPPAKPIAAITEADAQRFRENLIAEGLAEATIRKRCGDVRSIFGRACAARVLDRNPFDAVPVTVAGRDRRQHVTTHEAEKVMGELAGADWRLLFALGRWGGLRIPSEVYELKWDDIDWSGKRILIHEPKNERHTNREKRYIPLFPELERPLLDQRDQTPDDDPYVLSRWRWANGSAVRTTIQRAIKRSGVKPWDNLWRTLRATRQTELAQSHPEHVVCEWLGNTKKVARESYLNATEEDFKRAARGAARSAANISQREQT